MIFKISKQLFTVVMACAFIAFGLSGCANEDQWASATGGTKGVGIDFSGVISGEDSPGSRTGAAYGEINTNHDLGVNFFWTKDDYRRLFVNAGTDATPNWLTFTREYNTDSIMVNGVWRYNGASFSCSDFPTVYSDNYTGPFKVRYIGSATAATDSTLVKIERTQTQSSKGFADRIGLYGDCAIAQASATSWVSEKVGATWKSRLTKCSFTLQHQASYLTFMPYNLLGAMPNTYLKRITVSAKEALAGTFPFNDKGINVKTRPTTALLKTVTLTVDGDGLPIAKDREGARNNAGIMVVAPGEYNNLTVKMIIRDPSTGNQIDIEKNYAKLELESGKNQTVFHSLNIPDYTSEIGLHHMWGAKDYYWNVAHPMPNPRNWQFSGGIGSIPAPAAPNDNWPKGGGDSRWYSTGLEFPADYIAGAVGNMNVNDASYILNGICYWDADAKWTFDGHLFKGIMWVPKVIPGHTAAYDGQDWTGTATTKHITPMAGTPPTGGNYVALPALGYYENGALKGVGEVGYYWINNCSPDDDQNEAYCLRVSSSKVEITPATKKSLGCLVLRP